MIDTTCIQLENYRVQFGNVTKILEDFLSQRSYSKIGVLVDENTFSHCLPLLEMDLSEFIKIVIPSGEQNKQSDTCSKIWDQMQKAQFDRHSLLINLGGGVIGDMGGFAASTYMRGIDFIQIPTTLLSQVDASVGGKLAIDFKGFKNLIGLFNDPQLVIIDDVFLNTLRQKEIRSGFAEMLKHGLIQDEKSWRKLISEHWQSKSWLADIFLSVQVKAAVVREDPYERGLRKTLNFGHTIGHAVETLSFQGSYPLLHGEAIAIGMMIESHLSTIYSTLTTSEHEEIIYSLSKIYDDVDHSILEYEDRIIEIMLSDKKNKKGSIRGALLDRIGQCSFDHQLENEDIRKSLRNISYYLNHH